MALYVGMYLAAVVLANLTVTTFGPKIAVLNAFLFIGLDLTARDRLHDAWKNERLVLKMTALIAAGSAISFLLNHDSGRVALASLVAFAAAASVDTIVYHMLRHRVRWFRVNASNVPSAAVDSFIFPAMAFGAPLLWNIILGQFAAKVLGGFCWSFLLKGRRKFSTKFKNHEAHKGREEKNNIDVSPGNELKSLKS